MYRAYRWDAQEREQLRDVYEDLSQDPENAHLELTAPQKDALNSCASCSTSRSLSQV